jgi:hypothetical protein
MRRIFRHIGRHLFLYFFLAVQALFLAWVITGTSSASGNEAQAHAQAVHDCAGQGWKYLYNSYGDCVTKLGSDYKTASDAGTGVGVGLLLGLWIALDVLLLLGRVVVLLARRGSKKNKEEE